MTEKEGIDPKTWRSIEELWASLRAEQDTPAPDPPPVDAPDAQTFADRLADELAPMIEAALREVAAATLEGYAHGQQQIAAALAAKQAAREAEKAGATLSAESRQIIAALGDALSPEARAAIAAFEADSSETTARLEDWVTSLEGQMDALKAERAGQPAADASETIARLEAERDRAHAILKQVAEATTLAEQTLRDILADDDAKRAAEQIAPKRPTAKAIIANYYQARGRSRRKLPFATYLRQIGESHREGYIRKVKSVYDKAHKRGKLG